MCKTLPVLLVMGDSLNRAVYLNTQVSLKRWSEVQFAAGRVAVQFDLANFLAPGGIIPNGRVFTSGRRDLAQTTCARISQTALLPLAAMTRDSRLVHRCR